MQRPESSRQLKNRELSHISPLTGQPAELWHANMVPFYGGSIKQNVDVNAYESTLERHTGVSAQPVAPKCEHMNKEPTCGYGFVYGAPAMSSDVNDRYIPSYKRQGEKLIQGIQQGPGLGLRPDQTIPTAQSELDERRYALPKTVDCLRTATNPKVTYAGRVVSGLKGRERAEMGTMNRNRPELVGPLNRVNTTVGAVTKAKLDPAIIDKRTNRQGQTRQYEGIQGPADVYNPPNRAAIRESNKDQFDYKEEMFRNPYTNEMRNGDDYGKANVVLNPTERQSFGATAITNMQSIMQHLYRPLEDIVKSTKKEYEGERVAETSIVPKVYVQTVYDPTDVTKTTIKELNIDNTRNGSIIGPNCLAAYDPKDIARHTIKETNIHDSRSGGLIGPSQTPAYDPLNTAKVTIKEGNIHDVRTGDLKMPSQVPVIDANDIPTVTIKESNIHDNRTGDISLPNQMPAYDPNNIPQVTIKESNIHDNRTGDINLPTQMPAYDPNNIPRVTMKESNIHDNRTGDINLPNQMPAYDPQDTTRPTIKQTNIYDNKTGQIAMPSQMPSFDPNDKTRPTLKETNIHDTRTGDMKSIGQAPAYDPSAIARGTIKETNIHDNRSGALTAPVQTVVYDPADVARGTIKETNIHDNWEGEIKGATQVPAYDPADITRQTIKETNIHDNRSGSLHAPSQTTVYDPEDSARATIKETNIHDTRSGYLYVNPRERVHGNVQAATTHRETLEPEPIGKNLQGSSGLTVYDPNDIAKTTVKETNLNSNYTGNLNKIQDMNQQARKTKYVAQDTHRQYTHTDYTGNMDGNDTGGYKVAAYDAPETQKQTLSNNEYSGTAAGSSKPRTYEDIANMTTNIVREKIAKGRAPTLSSKKHTIGKNDINYDSKKNERHDMRDSSVTQVYQAGPVLNSASLTTQRTHAQEHNDRTSINLIDQLKCNPYALKPFFTEH